MFKNTIFRRMTALVLTLALAAAAALPGLAVYPMPIQTASETEAVYLFNADTGKTILNQNADQQQRLSLILPADLCAHFPDFRLDLFLCDEDTLDLLFKFLGCHR